MVRVIFVGIHNKPLTRPLDSSTKSGKLIDQVIQSIKEAYHFDSGQFIKSNLYNATSILNEPASITVYEWIHRVQYTKKDIIIALGLNVQKGFDDACLPMTIINMQHPSVIWSNRAKKEYIAQVVTQIGPAIESIFSKIQQNKHGQHIIN